MAERCKETHYFGTVPLSYGPTQCELDDDGHTTHDSEHGWWEVHRSPQPMPTPTTGPAIADLVLADLGERDRLGQRTYGTRLQAHNGRDALRDAYEEALDLALYLRQAIAERDGR